MDDFVSENRRQAGFVARHRKDAGEDADLPPGSANAFWMSGSSKTVICQSNRSAVSAYRERFAAAMM
jgi:hypothetical protein